MVLVGYMIFVPLILLALKNSENWVYREIITLIKIWKLTNIM